MSSGPLQPYPLAALTVVLGPPVHEERRAAFDDFQIAAAAGRRVVDHAWTSTEHAALDTLAARDGSLSTKTLLETWLGAVLQVNVIVADVERQWVRHEDQHLYVALTIVSEDVRPRAAAQALHDPALVDALNAVAGQLASLDGREWIRWSSRRWDDPAGEDQAQQAAGLVQRIATRVLGEGVPTGEVLTLTDDLVQAIAAAHADAGMAGDPLVRELRTLRYLDPLRTEWTLVNMDAFYLAALEASTVSARVAGDDARGLAYLYLGKDRTDRLKADPTISPRFRAEIAARSYMTAYALECVAPIMAASLHALITR